MGCTWNFYNCGVDTFCNESSANCQGDGSYKHCLDLTDDGSDESEPSPVSAPTDVSDGGGDKSVPSPVAAPTITYQCQSWCYTNTQLWEMKCGWVNCRCPDECGDIV